MTETAEDVRFFCRAWARQYKCQAQIFIGYSDHGRRLIARYDDNYRGPYLRLINGQREFSASIPDDWSEHEIETLLLYPTKAADGYPRWELAARLYGSPCLFRWWLGEKAR